jgi:hypothetical protein
MNLKQCASTVTVGFQRGRTESTKMQAVILTPSMRDCTVWLLQRLSAFHSEQLSTITMLAGKHPKSSMIQHLRLCWMLQCISSRHFNWEIACFFTKDIATFDDVLVDNMLLFFILSWILILTRGVVAYDLPIFLALGVWYTSSLCDDSLRASSLWWKYLVQQPVNLLLTLSKRWGG